MSRKRLGAIDPSRARDARTSAEEQARERRRAALGSGPPIAQVAADLGKNIDAEIVRLRDENAALTERSVELDAAVSEGRVVRRVALSEINPYALTRDRRALDREGEEWLALKASLSARGQQTPIEIVANGDDDGPGYDLVTGLRRWSALEELYRETGDDRFGSALAFIRTTDAPVDKLVAMIEENEIRHDISFFDRGRICALAAGQGVFESVDDAIDCLYAASNRNRKYKIRSFAALFEMAGDLLDYPEEIGERLGLALVKELRAGRLDELRSQMEQRNTKFSSASEEMSFLGDFVKRKGAFAASKASRARDEVRAEWRGAGGQRVSAVQKGEQVVLSIDGLADVNADSLQMLVDWLGDRMRNGAGE